MIRVDIKLYGGMNLFAYSQQNAEQELQYQNFPLSQFWTDRN